MSASKQARRRHRHHGNPFSVRCELEAPALEKAFARPAPLALDVGFGEGAFLLELAKLHPEWNVLGLEIRQHLVDELNEHARQQGLANALAVLANANVHLDALVPDDSVVFVAVNFPDPWFKRRHEKRRVVRPEWIATLERKLRHGAEVHAMSDYEPIARQIHATFSAHGRFENLAHGGGFAQASTTGIATERERKHMRRGQPVYRLHLRFLRG